MEMESERGTVLSIINFWHERPTEQMWLTRVGQSIMIVLCAPFEADFLYAFPVVAFQWTHNYTYMGGVSVLSLTCGGGR
jgi:hypothetical protein